MLIWTEETSPTIRKLLTCLQIVKLESEMENSKDANILTIFQFSIYSLSLIMYGCADSFLMVGLVSAVQRSSSL